MKSKEFPFCSKQLKIIITCSFFMIYDNEVHNYNVRENERGKENCRS